MEIDAKNKRVTCCWYVPASKSFGRDAGTVKQRFYGTVYGVRRRTNALECALIRASARGSARAGAYACIHIRTLFGHRKTDHSWCYTVHVGHECTTHMHTHARARVRARCTFTICTATVRRDDVTCGTPVEHAHEMKR